MAEVEVTVAASGADYTTITAAINDWATHASASDDYIVTLLEDITEDVTCDVEAEGLGTVTIRSTETDPSSFPIITGGVSVTHNDTPTTVSHLKVTTGMAISTLVAGIYGNAGTTNDILFVENCIVYGINASDGHVYGIGFGSMGGYVSNCLVYDLVRQTGGTGNQNIYGIIMPSNASINCDVLNCIVDDITGGSSGGQARGIRNINNATHRLRNVAGSRVSHDAGGSVRVWHVTADPWNGDWDYLASDDSTHQGANSVAVDAATDYVDADARDYTSPSDGALVGVGEDLTTENNSNLALNGDRDRDVEGDTWDIGCFQYFVASPGVTNANSIFKSGVFSSNIFNNHIK